MRGVLTKPRLPLHHHHHHHHQLPSAPIIRCSGRRHTRCQIHAVASSDGDDEETRRRRQHQELYARIASLPPESLPAFVAAERERLTTAFLAYVAEQQQKGNSGGGGFSSSHRGLSKNNSGASGNPPPSGDLAARLLELKDAADLDAAKRLLPPLAASAAYENYNAWRRDNGGAELADVAPGVPLEQVYKAGEAAERALLQGRGSGLFGSGSSSSGNSSSSGPPGGSFARAAAAAGYGDMAAAAMERVRARLMGYQDDADADADEGGDEGAQGGGNSSGSGGGGPATRRVLRALLVGCACREERAEAVAEACVPPGLLVADDSGGSGVRVCTTPARLLAAIADVEASLESGSSSSSAGGSSLPSVLPSGEPLAEALRGLREDAAGYERAVWARLSPLERYGAAAAAPTARGIDGGGAW